MLVQKFLYTKYMMGLLTRMEVRMMPSFAVDPTNTSTSYKNFYIVNTVKMPNLEHTS